MTRRVVFVDVARKFGLSRSEIRSELDQLPEGRIPEQQAWARLTGTWHARVDV